MVKKGSRETQIKCTLHGRKALLLSVSLVIIFQALQDMCMRGEVLKSMYEHILFKCSVRSPDVA